MMAGKDASYPLYQKITDNSLSYRFIISNLRYINTVPMANYENAIRLACYDGDHRLNRLQTLL